MSSLRSTFQGLLAFSLVLGSHAIPKPGSNPLHSLAARSDIDCSARFDAATDPDGAKELWDASRAGQLADDFINEHGVAEWVRNLNYEIFGRDDGNWDCFSSGSTCELDKTCDEYVAAGHGKAYYLFYQLEKVRDYINTFENALTSATMKQHLKLAQMAEDFKSEEPEEQPDIFGIVSGSFGMLGAMAPQLAGPAGFVGGMSSLVGAANTDDEPDVDFGELHAMLSLKLEKAFSFITKRLDEIALAIFGKEGYDQKLIPAEMTKQAWDNTVVNALGDGQWLIAHASDGVDALVESMYTTLKEGLVWAAIRYGRKGFWFIDTDVEKGKCGDGDNDHPGEWWDDKAGGCVKLMSVVDKPRKRFEYLDQETSDKLWGNGGLYDLDRKRVFHNALDCWERNGGVIGEVDIETMHEESSRPVCFYGAHIAKGKKDSNCIMVLDGWAGYAQGREWIGEHHDDQRLKTYPAHSQNC